MDRIATVLKLLAFLAVAAGGVCFALAYRPAGLAGWLDAARHFAPRAVAHPAVVVAAAVAVAAALAARRLERTPPVTRSRRRVHRPRAEVAPAAERTVDVDGAAARRRRARWRPALETRLRAGDVVAFVDGVLAGAVAAGASDVHLEPLELHTRVLYRVGGELEEVATAPQAKHEEIVRRVKVLAGLVTFHTDRPQDGRIALDAADGAVDLRVAVMPTHHGEKVVLRLARPASELLELERLGMPEEVRRRFEALLAEPQGMIVLTGPTGSGKTTTLYSALGHVHESRGDVASLATIEDPVEIDLPFLDQTAVDRAAGLGFRDALRAVLRQDPNVLMVGEVRDAETAGAAVQAALSGHLILTTLHAGSAAGVFPRLIDLGVEPFLAASSVLAAASQRLARRLCPACRHPAPPTRAQAAELTARRIDATGLTFQVAEGCSRCGGSGNAGRVPIFELLPATPELRREITAGANIDRLEELATSQGMVPLRRAAVALAAAGTISLGEALRVTG